MTITASLVKELREKTNVGMMACKNALVKTEGDLQEAIKYLREKGLASASKKSERATKEGMVFVSVSDDKNKGAVVELNCETDFVASNEAFKALGQEISAHVLQNDTIDSSESLEGSTINGADFKTYLSESILKLGENITIGSVQKVSSAGQLASYVHMNGKIGVLIEFASALDQELGKDIAMHIAAAQPEYLSREDVPSTRLDEEKEVLRKQLENEGKPENIIENIIKGKLNKFYGTVCLLEQEFVKDSDKKISQLIDGNSINAYHRIAI